MIKRQTVTSQVIDHIVDLIKTGQIKPGQRLPTEKELTEKLGVSRTCVREAMKSLESLRMVSTRPKVGTVALHPSPESIFHAQALSTAAHLQHTDALIELRKILEVGLAELAAKKADEEDLAAMLLCLEDHKRAIETDGVTHRQDIAFHEALANASKNPFCIMILKMISEPLAEQRRRTNQVPNAPEEGLRDHLKIFKAIKEKSAARARAAMLSHLGTAERNWRLACRLQHPNPRAPTSHNF
jgi:GntR family transcriptional regulator, transcriptional repressor for pyruvate dehydrogenase complex